MLDDDLDEVEALLTDLEALGVLDDDGEVLTDRSRLAVLVEARNWKRTAGAAGK